MVTETVRANRRLCLLDELPPCIGPKLRAFPNRRPKIQWLQQLERSPGSELGSQGYVFRVKIDSRIYALKVFKFFKPSDAKYLLSPVRAKKVSDEIAAFHVDPFYAECRAYGRIQKQEEAKGLKSRIAANCYGFLCLQKKHELQLAEMGIDLWDLPEEDEYRQQAEGSPIRAILKEYIEEETEFNSQNCKEMLKKLRRLNRWGVVHRDIQAGNYKNGLLIDLGSAWTEPHCIMKAVPKDVADGWRQTDMSQFDEMLKEKGIGKDMHILPNLEYHKKLRSWKP
ncbi:kinetochore Sim4 complex subunit FTA2-domain-containing protein [Annulohypoxylon maeteangense]|uniref:kinetochore Sim4 complex subunit FTA2-domain-containing protein n=1 Tax=Annulohypoxylon maeteangense TaxID=1927788 RepID=UPI0020074E56|nr:kinetochore Sim4 complex subunit FTA2-domain-containing protein [Annulohypoxylon maeteangense]KAI0888814.1 kinetochore Sim4 complex subunit FTA2-domain-containing protein [Annulohypoxylon maeteangense]